MYDSLLEEFAGRRVVDFEEPSSWQGPERCYRLREEYDDPVKVTDRLAALLEQPGSDRLAALIIGAWSGACEGENAAQIVAQLAQAAPRLPGLRSLFLGEMTYEECEISWINQTNLAPLLAALPKLEELRVRGGTGLSFSKIAHMALKKLAIETGGLPRSAIREIFLCDFPTLEHLELLLGEQHYGFDGSVEDFQPLLSGKRYPHLKFLGLMNSAISNDIAAVVVNSPIVERLETLDLSLGNLDAEGIASLTALASYKNLKRLNISHHYAPGDAVAALVEALPFEVVADDPQEPEDEWRPTVHNE
ncbi:MAG TPA: STM4015 family protein [Pirellulales bacterium]|nr:STM4015 family protein [Pirellulales bacterium]